MRWFWFHPGIKRERERGEMHFSGNWLDPIKTTSDEICKTMLIRMLLNFSIITRCALKIESAEKYCKISLEAGKQKVSLCNINNNKKFINIASRSFFIGNLWNHSNAKVWWRKENEKKINPKASSHQTDYMWRHSHESATNMFFGIFFVCRCWSWNFSHVLQMWRNCFMYAL